MAAGTPAMAAEAVAMGKTVEVAKAMVEAAAAAAPTETKSADYMICQRHINGTLDVCAFSNYTRSF